MFCFGCADRRHDAFAADTAGVVDGMLEAPEIVELVNGASIEELVDEVVLVGDAARSRRIPAR